MPHQTLQVTCKVMGFRVLDGDIWCYRLSTSPWTGYYASADAFCNDQSTGGSLKGTPSVDPRVPDCG